MHPLWNLYSGTFSSHVCKSEYDIYTAQHFTSIAGAPERNMRDRSRASQIDWHATACKIMKNKIFALTHSLKTFRHYTLTHIPFKNSWLTEKLMLSFVIYFPCSYFPHLLHLIMFLSLSGPTLGYLFGLHCRISSIQGIPLLCWWLYIWIFFPLASSLFE